MASCQFPVSGDLAANARYIRRFMRLAAASGATLLHTPEASLSGYAGCDFASFYRYDWDTLRRATTHLRELAARLNLWLVLGSAHHLDARTKPTNCLYLIGPDGSIVNRYDKSMLTLDDQKHYAAGNRRVTHDIRGVRIGLAICYDICFPQMYAAYRELGASVMIHSFYNARHDGPTCLDVLNVRQVPTRCADNRLWAVANNSTRRFAGWASFVARPDATIAQQLPKHRAGMLMHRFPDGLSSGGWLHNRQPMRLAPDQQLHFGEPTRHPRQVNGQAEP
ncbi:MAG: carbon-nitrogen hydrolase family protein [Lentisphaerae bacterium]|nr:carbon-nitrogen hydrolase family protein [Lentisphaerota bacterium]